MSTLMQTAERIAAAGCSRAFASFDGAGADYASSGSATAAFRGWVSNPTQGMPVQPTKRHLTPALRPEEASP
jgi:hypothetical protein